MDTISADTTVSELVQDRPARSRVFESLGINYCCAGDKTLHDVCNKKKLEAPAVIAMLEAADLGPVTVDAPDAETMGMEALCGHIVESHHAYLRKELPRLGTLLEKVARVHGDHDPRLREMYSLYGEMASVLLSHVQKEEQILFPAIQKLANGLAGFPSGLSITQPIAQMETEHTIVDSALRELGVLSDGFKAPDWACNTYRAVLDGLRELVDDTARHVEKEDGILFPKATQREKELRAASQHEADGNATKAEENYTLLPSLADHVSLPDDGILSKLVVTDPHIRVTMFGLSEGEEMTEHTTSMEAMLQFVEGTAKVTLGNDEYEVGAGTWIRMTPGLPHSIKALSPVKMLLIILRNTKQPPAP